jgi:NADP-dependent 3-hydroxy acid dehydrogenase YdfG
MSRATFRAKPDDGVVWITGASSGIGRSVALEMAKRGYTVAISARRLEELEKIALEAHGLAGRLVAHAVDVTDQQSMEECIQAIETAHGDISLAFFNAGVALYSTADALDIELFKKTYDVNVMGVINGLAPLLQRMAKRGRGQVAVNASVAGYSGLPRAAAYCSSKAAMITVCEALKFDCDKLGITLQVVNPGFVDTPLTKKNDFPMPFLLSMDEAAKRTCDGFATGGFEITYPRRLSWILKFMSILPYALYFPIIRWTTDGKR